MSITTPALARKYGEAYRHYFVGQEGALQYNRVYGQRANDVMGGILSTDLPYIRVKKKTVERLQEFDVDVREDGLFGPTVVGTNWTELLTASGCPMSPMTVNVVDNTVIRTELNLNDKFESNRDELIFEELMMLKYASHDGSLGKISKISGSGFPYFSHNVEHKVQHLNFIARNIDMICDLIIRGDFQTLLVRYGVVLANSSVLRSQAEGGKYVNGRFVPKERLVNDLEYALSSGQKGKRFVANKSVIKDGQILADTYAARARSAYAVPFPINSAFTAIIEGFRHYADHTYSFTYKHRSRLEMALKARKFKFFLPLDVSQYDQSIPWYLVRKWLDVIPLSDKAKAVVELLLKAPKFYSAVDNTHDPIFTGNPEDIADYKQWGGLPSGAFLTSMLGKDMFTFAVLCMFDRHYHDVVGNIDKILKGDHHYGLFNTGDDSVLMSNESNIISELRLMQDEKGSMSEYFKVEIEQGLRYLGNCGYRNEAGEIMFCADISSYLKNMLVPERGVNSKHRLYAYYGMMVRRDAFKDHPLFFKVEEIFQKAFREEYGYDWYAKVQENVVFPSVISDGESLSQEDIEVLADPYKLYYKYEESDISDRVVSIIQEKISQQNTDLLMKVLVA